ncbi:histidine kinase [Parabacteroides sp. OttesenSCG-928-G07]|nr:histidine kinase [Parabacteroides sp. OttesenSCG-928-G21]MDL2278062.1 histidine kinase [Parabacteroides sp. OttesenSCG-928-G07]
MNLLGKYATLKLGLLSLLCATLVSFPNLAYFQWRLDIQDVSLRSTFIIFFIVRYAYFIALFWLLLYYNLKKKLMVKLKPRILYSCLIGVPAYLLYVFVTFPQGWNFEHINTISAQFFAIIAMSILIGQLAMLFIKQRINEKEIEQLKIENLQSQCNALTNQINPHFFFNSLNGITALVRKDDKKKTIKYINTLSDVFRYILQSDKKGLVTLDEELQFVESFRYLMEVRYANKLTFGIEVDENKMNLRIPVLSLLPLVENVITHNQIDSDSLMKIRIYLNEQDELVVSNPVFPLFAPADTNGTGLANLKNRFRLMLNSTVRVESDDSLFSIFLPLK